MDEDDLELPMQLELVEGQTSATVRIFAKEDQMEEQQEAGALIMEVEGFAQPAKEEMSVRQ